MLTEMLKQNSQWVTNSQDLLKRHTQHIFIQKSSKNAMCCSEYYYYYLILTHQASAQTYN